MTATERARSLGKGRLFWVALAALLVLTAVALGRGTNSGPALSPRSTDPLGTLALVELLESRGHDVDLLDPGDGAEDFGGQVEEADVVLVVRDDLDSSTRAELRAWVTQGHDAVVFDSSSPLIDVPAQVGATPLRSVGVGDCDIAELEDLATISSGGFVTYDTAEADRSCFVVDAGAQAAVIRSLVGDGRVTALGGASMITNERLADDDNAAVVVRLVEAAGPSVRVGIVYDPALVTGTRTLGDLLPDDVGLTLWQLLIAAGILVWWQGRRFGGVVDEPRLVRLPGSLRVRAAAELRRRSGECETASGILSAAFERNVRRRHRLPPDLSVDQLPGVLATRHGAASVDPGRFALACGRPLAVDDAALAAQLAAIDDLSVRLDLVGGDADLVVDLTGDRPNPASTPTIEVSQ